MTETVEQIANLIYVDRIKEGRFEDTNKLFVPPEHYDIRVQGQQGMQYYAEEISYRINPQPKRLY